LFRLLQRIMERSANFFPDQILSHQSLLTPYVAVKKQQRTLA
jgi:hypothetical protein